MSYPIELRRVMVDLMLKGMRPEDLETEHGPNANTMRAWMRQYETEGHLRTKPTNRPGGNRPRKLTAVHERFLRALLSEQPDLFLREMAEALRTSERLAPEDRVEVAPSTICNALKRMGLTRKKNSSTTHENSSRRTSSAASNS